MMINNTLFTQKLRFVMLHSIMIIVLFTKPCTLYNRTAKNNRTLLLNLVKVVVFERVRTCTIAQVPQAKRGPLTGRWTNALDYWLTWTFRRRCLPDRWSWSSQRRPPEPGRSSADRPLRTDRWNSFLPILLLRGRRRGEDLQRQLCATADDARRPPTDSTPSDVSCWRRHLRQETYFIFKIEITGIYAVLFGFIVAINDIELDFELYLPIYSKAALLQSLI